MIKRLLLFSSLLFVLLALPASAENKDYTYEYYFENSLGGKLRVHDMRPCEDPTIMSRSLNLVAPLIVTGSSTDQNGKVLYEACVMIDPINRAFIFIWLDDYSTVAFSTNQAKQNTDPATLPDHTKPRPIPYRRNYRGPFYYSL